MSQVQRGGTGLYKHKVITDSSGGWWILILCWNLHKPSDLNRWESLCLNPSCTPCLWPSATLSLVPTRWGVEWENGWALIFIEHLLWVWYIVYITLQSAHRNPEKVILIPFFTEEEMEAQWPSIIYLQVHSVKDYFLSVYSVHGIT